MNETDALLIRILAETDALWRPMRKADWHGNTPAVRSERQKRFLEAGVQIDPPDRTTAGRMPFSRLLDDAQAQGLIDRRTVEKRHHAKLTPPGDDYARSLTAVPTVAESHGLLRRLIDLEVRTPVGRLASELWLAGAENYGTPQATRAISDCELTMLALLAHGLAVSRSDVHGRTWYATTPAGREFAAGPAPAPPDGPEPTEECMLEYHHLAAEARARLRSATPANENELGFLPLPASIDAQRPKLKRQPAKR